MHLQIICNYFFSQIDANDDVVMMLQKHIVTDYHEQKVLLLNIEDCFVWVTVEIYLWVIIIKYDSCYSALKFGIFKCVRCCSLV